MLHNLLTKQGGANLVGDAKSWCAYVSKNLCVKMKASGPLGGTRRMRLPGSANAKDSFGVEK